MLMTSSIVLVISLLSALVFLKKFESWEEEKKKKPVKWHHLTLFILWVGIYLSSLMITIHQVLKFIFE